MDDDPASSPVAFSIIREGGFRLDIALIEIDRLYLHEETIPELLDALTDEIEEEGVLQDPVIVERENLVVLDGMHRVKALKRLGCRLIPVCLVDYDSPEIKVERWCRTFGDSGRMAELKRCIESTAFEIREMQRDEAKEMLEAGVIIGVLETNADNYAIVSDKGMDKLSAFKAISEIEERLKSEGLRIGYETERDAEEKLRAGKIDAVILPPKIDKREVVETAVRGEVLIHKATRHIIPVRPMGVDAPVPLLRIEKSCLGEAREQLLRMLREKHLKRIPPGSLWKGRRYEEELYVFE